jgi:hypothetical protein
LSEADAALRKALASINALEAGFSLMLNKEAPLRAAEGGPAISAQLFEGKAHDVVAEVSASCAKIAPLLRHAAESLGHALESPAGFTVEHYQQGYSLATTTARTTLELLTQLLGLLRLEIAAETLPLITWRLHHQIQEIAEALRWGVLRG